MIKKKGKKGEITEELEPSNKEKIRLLGEIETGNIREY